VNSRARSKKFAKTKTVTILSLSSTSGKKNGLIESSSNGEDYCRCLICFSKLEISQISRSRDAALFFFHRRR